jgi:hypothetical protein
MSLCGLFYELSVARMPERQMSNELENRGLVQFLSLSCLERTTKSMKNLCLTAGVPTEIRFEYFPDTCLERFCCASPSCGLLMSIYIENMFGSVFLRTLVK